MQIVITANQRVSEMLTDDHDTRREAREKFELIEREHSDSLRIINKRICEIGQEHSTNGSKRSHLSRMLELSFSKPSIRKKVHGVFAIEKR